MTGPKSMRALLVQADTSTTNLVVDALHALGAIVEHAATGAYALQLVRRGDYDLVVLGGMPGDSDGYDVIRGVRRARIDTPIMMIASSLHSQATMLALQVGADDCVGPLKESRELVLRIQALLQRARGGNAKFLTRGPVELDPRAMEVLVNGEHVRLTGKEFAVLKLLLERKGRAITKEDFMSHLYDGSDDPETKVIDVFICKVRSKLAAAGAPDIIKTIWGKGYMISSSRDSDPCKSLPFFRVPDPAGKTGC
jgi:two-component system cell cycle response regulator CtrA